MCDGFLGPKKSSSRGIVQGVLYRVVRNGTVDADVIPSAGENDLSLGFRGFSSRWYGHLAGNKGEGAGRQRILRPHFQGDRGSTVKYRSWVVRSLRLFCVAYDVLTVLRGMFHALLSTLVMVSPFLCPAVGECLKWQPGQYWK